MDANDHRYRSHSWPGEDNHIDSIDDEHQHTLKWTVFLKKEITSVALWALITPLVRIFFHFLVQIAKYRDLWREIMDLDLRGAASVLAGWFLRAFPSKVGTQQAPGFIFSLASMLTFIQGTCGAFPNLSLRVCEWRMGRLSLLRLMMSILIHCGFTSLIWFSLANTLPQSLSNKSLAPVMYKERGRAHMEDFGREVLATFLLCIGILVLPELSRLNRISPWFTLILLYPIYNASVDSEGHASVLSPSVLLGQAMVDPRSRSSLWRVLPQMMGGLIAGKVMEVYFPDDPKA